MVRSLVGTRIRERRRAQKMSQKALAEKAGISQSYMNLIEHNHRTIAGRTLLAIADSLQIDSRELSDDANLDVLNELQDAAAQSTTHVELHRIEEYLARFPGWATLSAQLHEENQIQWDKLQALSDRLGTDPFFAEAMHLMLSNVTVIKSTSEILAQNDDIDPTSVARFLSNMQAESTRLTETISKLLDYFEDNDGTQFEKGTQISSSKLDDFWDTHQYHCPALEELEVFSEASFGALASDWHFDESGERQRALRSFQRYHRTAKMMPLDPFITIAKQYSYNPNPIAHHFRCDIHDVFYRLAHLPQGNDTSNLPEFGLIECDGSGGVLFRKAVKDLSLPRKSSACPLWPLYRAISQPMQPIRTFIETPTGDSFLTISIAKWSDHHEYGLPGTINSAMLFTADHPTFLLNQERRLMGKINVGLNCEVCPRPNCSARRAPSILDIA